MLEKIKKNLNSLRGNGDYGYLDIGLEEDLVYCLEKSSPSENSYQEIVVEIATKLQEEKHISELFSLFAENSGLYIWIEEAKANGLLDNLKAYQLRDILGRILYNYLTYIGGFYYEEFLNQ